MNTPGDRFENQADKALMLFVAFSVLVSVVLVLALSACGISAKSVQTVNPAPQPTLDPGMAACDVVKAKDGLLSPTDLAQAKVQFARSEDSGLREKGGEWVTGQVNHANQITIDVMTLLLAKECNRVGHPLLTQES